MTKLKIVAFDDLEKVPSISYLGFSIDKKVYDKAIVIPSEKSTFDTENIMLSLSVQLKMKVQTNNIDIRDEDAVTNIINMVASRDSNFHVLPIKSLLKTPTDYVGLYKLDLNQVFIKTVSTGHTMIRKIGDPYKVSSIIDGLLKLAKG